MSLGSEAHRRLGELNSTKGFEAHALPHKVLSEDGTGTTTSSSSGRAPLSTWCPSPMRGGGQSISSVGSCSRSNGDSHFSGRWSGDASVDHLLLQSPSGLSQAALEACDSDDAFTEEATITCWLQPPPGGQRLKASAAHGHSGGSNRGSTNGQHQAVSAAACGRDQFSAFAWDERCPPTQVSECDEAGTSDHEQQQQQPRRQAVDEAARRLSTLHRRGSWSCPPHVLVPSDDYDNGETSHRSGCLGGGASDLSGAPSAPAVMVRSRSNYHLTNRHATVELFLRLNHARQTLDYVKRQASAFSALDKTSLNVWEALSQLNELHDYEATLMRNDLSPDMPLLAHAFQTAELCRLRHPELDWLHLVGLIHGLGKLLAHGRWGSQPQWAISGESFPVGCRFSTQVEGAEFFMANPDRRRRQLNTPCGMYAEHCGLTNVYMSWSAAEYLYLVLALNDTSLPPEALFIVRHQKFWTLLAGGSDGYAQLLSPDDARMLPLLAEFQQLSRYHDEGPLPAGALQGPELRKYYGGLIAKYLGGGKLCW